MCRPGFLFPFPFEDRVLLEEILSEQKGEKVRLAVPRRGEARHWLEMAEENARSALKGKEADQNFLETIAAPLQERLELNRRPDRVGALDISNLQGRQAVGSWVVFHQGPAGKIQLSPFSHPHGGPAQRLCHDGRGDRPSDPASRGNPRPDTHRWRERAVKYSQGNFRPPAGKTAAGPGGYRQKNLSGSSGGKRRDLSARTQEPGGLRPESPVLHFLQRVRDEAHRFALSYHHLLREKEIRSAPG